MPELQNGKLKQMLAENALLEQAHYLATRDALLEHARMGRAVSVSRGGHLISLSPEEVFARYGLDANGKPKG